MKPPRVRWNTTEARVERFVRLAQRLDLPVFGFEVRGRDVTVLTHPRGDGPAATPLTVLTHPRGDGPAATPPEADPVDRWFRDNASASAAVSAQSRKKQ